MTLMDWTKVVTDPLGLAGFALALVFGTVARKRGAGWIAATLLAAVCIAGGLTIAYRRAEPAVAKPAPAAPSQTPTQAPPAEPRNQAAPVSQAPATPSQIPARPDESRSPAARVSRAPAGASVHIEKLEQGDCAVAGVIGNGNGVTCTSKDAESKE
jgi:hypothetical protein